MRFDILHRIIAGFKTLILAACLIMGLLLPYSCMKDNAMTLEDSVRLKGCLVTPGQIVTKGEGVLNPSYNKELTLGMARIDEKTTPLYPSFENAGAQLKAVMKPGSSNINFRDISFTDSFQIFKDEVSEISYASWYPYSPTSYDPKTFTVTTPIDGNTDILYGDVATGNQQTGFNTIYFNHALCKFTFHVYIMSQDQATSEHMANVWGKLMNIKLVGLDNKCTITLPESPLDGYTIGYQGRDASNIIAIDKEVPGSPLLEIIPDGQNNAKILKPIIAAPPADGILRVEVETDNGKTANSISSKKMTIARNFKPGRNYEIFLRFSDHGLINAEVAVGEWIDKGDAGDGSMMNEVYFDLSRSEHANCYVVTSANYNYCFDVTTIGNGPDGAFNGMNTTIDPGYLDVIWMTKGLENNFMLSNHVPIQGKALFKVTNSTADPDNKLLDNEGNVLLGAYDKDPAEGGQLLWTWHIWLTDRPQDQAYRNGFVVQDRDLGALAFDVDKPEDAHEIDGLFYQWGRPTPLPLIRDVVRPIDESVVRPIMVPGSEPITVLPTEPVMVTDNAAPADMLTRIKNPLSFYQDAASIQDDPDFLRYWGYNLNTLEYNKTIYDPCPPGYRLPSQNLFLHMDHMKMSFNKNHQHAFISTIETYYYLNNPLTGYYTGVNAPVGYFEKNSWVSLDAGAYLWSGSVDIDKEPLPEKLSPYALDCKLGSGLVPQQGAIVSHTPTHALPVRCVSKRSLPEIVDLSAYQTANTYIISKNGYFKFDATVRGNGICKLVSPTDGKEIDISEGLAADIKDKAYRVVPLWWQGDLSKGENGDPTGNMPVEFIDNGKLAEGDVYFYIDTFREGNLIVAVQDQFDNILWTWHLWLTDKPAIHKSYDFAVMDRFLGATACPTTTSMTEAEALASMGFYYQWGRKDPFPGPGSFGNTATWSTWWKYDDKSKSWTEKTTGLDATTNVKAEKTVKASVANPTRFHRASTNNFYGGETVIPRSENMNLNDSYDDPENQTYSDAKVLESMWGYSALAGGFGKTTTKTMYDPCPPGYSVAYYLIWRSSDSSGGDIYTKLDHGLINATSMTEESAGKGIFLKRVDFSHTWYPYGGYIDCMNANLRQVGEVGRFYTSTPKEKTCRSMAYWKDGNNSNIITTQGLAINVNRGLPTSYGFPLRCQKD